MKLIVTRPEPAASKTAEKLRALGHEVAVSPVLEIVATGSEMPSGGFSMVIITSANALRVLEQHGFDQTLLDIPIYVVGDETAKKARELGFHNVHSATGNAKDLLALIKLQFIQSADDKRSALYICGEHSTPGFTIELSKIGLIIQKWANYKANLVDQLTKKSLEFLSSGEPVGILLYSARSAAQFNDNIERANAVYYLENIKIFALSDRVKNGLPIELQKVSEIANKPDEQSMVALIAT